MRPRALPVRIAAMVPELVVLIDGNAMSVDPTDAHVPLQSAAGGEVDALNFA